MTGTVPKGTPYACDASQSDRRAAAVSALPLL
jgi:hypothetical protein